jgi:hypothetical protein
MDRRLTVLLNEYQTIKDFRERCIRNIEEATRTYFIFLGFVVTATSFYIEKKIENVYLASILSILVLAGFLIYYLNIQTHINFIKYTRKLNKTRKQFLDFKIPKEYLTLGTDEKHPKYDRIGFLDLRFSRNGSLRIIQVFNTIIGIFATYLLLEETMIINLSIYECREIVSLFAGGFIYQIHFWINDRMINKAKETEN